MKTPKRSSPCLALSPTTGLIPLRRIVREYSEENGKTDRAKTGLVPINLSRPPLPLYGLASKQIGLPRHITSPNVASCNTASSNNNNTASPNIASSIKKKEGKKKLNSVYRRHSIDLIETRKITPYILVPDTLVWL